jgi:hypothetical protein
MRRVCALVAIASLALGCEHGEPEPEVVVTHLHHYYYEEDTTPDVVRETYYEVVEVTETVYVYEEDTTPDVVQEFYSDAADLPMLVWDTGGGLPMAKKFRELNGGVAQTTLDAQDAVAVSKSSGASSQFVEFRHWPFFDYIGGLITSPSVAGDPLTDIDVAAGIAMANDNSHLMQLTSAITKQLDSAWAVGTNAGGLDTGSEANSTFYAIWLICKPRVSGTDVDSVDVLFSTSFTAPTMPAGYTKQRLIGAFYNDSGGNILDYTQSGDHFEYNGSIADLSDSTLTSGATETATITVPPLARAQILYRFLTAGGTTPDTLDVRISTNGSAQGQPNNRINLNSASNGIQQLYGTIDVLVDSSRQVEYEVNWDNAPTTEDLFFLTLGFEMHTRSHPQ